MKTVVIGADVEGATIYNPGLIALASQRMRHQRRIAPIADHRRQYPGDAKPPGGICREQDTAIESRADLLAPDGWQIEGQKAIVGHDGRGEIRLALEIGFNVIFFKQFRYLSYDRQLKNRRPLNKTGQKFEAGSNLFFLRNVIITYFEPSASKMTLSKYAFMIYR